jgi:hypothetical protein
MSNNNLADISAFESIQSEQHNRTNTSPMSVFNDKATYNSAMKRIALYKEELKKQCASASKTTQEATNMYKNGVDNFAKFRQKLQKDLIQTNIPDREKLDDAEHDRIIDEARKVVDGATYFEDRLSKAYATVRQNEVD